MDLTQAIEFTLRVHSRGMHAEEVLADIKYLGHHEDIDSTSIHIAVSSASHLFQVGQGGLIELLPDRMADRTGFFREHLYSIHDALYNVLFGTSVKLTLALLYAVATRKGQDVPGIVKKGEGSWPILDALTEEFPDLKREIETGLMALWHLKAAHVERALWALALARLTPHEYVKEMRRLILRNLDKHQFCMPWPVAELMSRLLGEVVEEVLDPLGDHSILPVTLMRNPKAISDALFTTEFGRFFNTLQVRILGANMRAYTLKDGFVITKKHYRHCIAAPLFGAAKQELRNQGTGNEHGVILHHFINMLAPNGRAVFLVPEDLLFAEAHSEFREQLLTANLVKMVVSLPIGVLRPYASTKTSILIVEKADHDQEIRFIDAAAYAQLGAKREMTLDVDRFMRDLDSSSALREVIIPLTDVLKDKDKVLSADRYLRKSASTGLGHGEAVEEIHELSTVVSRMSLPVNADTNVPFFQIGDLASHVVDIVRTAEHGRWERTAADRRTTTLNEPALLVAQVGGVLKPTLFDPAKGPIAIGSNILAFKVDTERIDPLFLALELRSGAVQEQVANITKGGGLGRLQTTHLLRMLVRIPDRAVQLQLVAEQYDLGAFLDNLKASTTALEGEDLEHFAQLIERNVPLLGTSGLQRVLIDWMAHERKVVEQKTIGAAMENMKMLRHQLNSRLGGVTTGVGNIRHFIQRLIDERTIPEDMPTAPSLEGEERPAPKITESMDQLMAHTKQLDQLIEALTRNLEHKGPVMQDVVLMDYFKEDIIPLYSNHQLFKLNVHWSSNKSTSIYADPSILKDVITNVMDNAVKHGFTDPSKHYNLYLGISEHMVLIANDGNPPVISMEEMIIRGSSAGDNAGSGLGMYMAYTKLESMGGALGRHQNPDYYFTFNGDHKNASDITIGITVRFPYTS